MQRKNSSFSDPKLPHGTNRCKCVACGLYFSSVWTFDRHRVGDYTARRCLRAEEMALKGWFLAPSGHWTAGKKTVEIVSKLKGESA